KDADYAYVYDAWNNLVKVRAQNDADVVVGVYAYYADNRRASKTVTNRGELDGVTYFFYDGLREIEERNGSEQMTQQYVWGHEYIDQLLMVRGAGGTWFVHQDANWNVIALTTPNGDVAEEYQYQPYGLPQVKRHLAFGDADADGDVDSADNTAHTNALTTYNRAFDADFDGDVSNTSGDADKEAWDASYNNPAASTTMVVVNRSFSPSGNPFLFTGRRLDPETGLYHYRFRTYHPTLKTFIQRDPLGYVDSASLYQYVGGRPWSAVDPSGDRIKLTGSNTDRLLKAIQEVMPSVGMDAQGFLTIPDSAANGSFTERLLYLLINMPGVITIRFGEIKEDSPGKTVGLGIKIDPKKLRNKFKTKGGNESVFHLWQIIFHELFHALNNALNLMKPSLDEEYCVACAANKVTEEYNRKNKGKEAPLLDSGTQNGDCPDYEDILKPPQQGDSQPPSNDQEKPMP
ncbi:RHS repeat-associated core domain-containing protein, partial [bacterium]|nr:RHS repeat-associated core domain-containing protein [bacterium]